MTQGQRGRIQSGNKPLGGSLFISRCSVYLSCKKKPRHITQAQCARQSPRIHIVIFNRIARLRDNHVFQTADCTNILFLNLGRQGRRNPVWINRGIVKTLGFKKDLMGCFVCKSNDLIFDRRAVPGPNASDMTTIHRRSGKVCPNDLVRLLIRMGDATRYLPGRYLVRQEREKRGLVITRLHFQYIPVDRSPVQPRWRSRLEPA